MWNFISPYLPPLQPFAVKLCQLNDKCQILLKQWNATLTLKWKFYWWRCLFGILFFLLLIPHPLPSGQTDDHGPENNCKTIKCNGFHLWPPVGEGDLEFLKLFLKRWRAGQIQIKASLRSNFANLYNETPEQALR